MMKSGIYHRFSAGISKRLKPADHLLAVFCRWAQFCRRQDVCPDVRPEMRVEYIDLASQFLRQGLSVYNKIGEPTAGELVNDRGRSSQKELAIALQTSSFSFEAYNGSSYSGRQVSDQGLFFAHFEARGRPVKDRERAVVEAVYRLQVFESRTRKGANCIIEDYPSRVFACAQRRRSLLARCSNGEVSGGNSQNGGDKRLISVHPEFEAVDRGDPVLCFLREVRRLHSRAIARAIAIGEPPGQQCNEYRTRDRRGGDPTFACHRQSPARQALCPVARQLARAA